MTSTDRFPVPVRSAVKSNLTDWCFQKLSKHDLNALTVQASTTKLRKLFQMFTMRGEKKCFRKYIRPIVNCAACVLSCFNKWKSISHVLWLKCRKHCLILSLGKTRRGYLLVPGTLLLLLLMGVAAAGRVG